MTDNLPATREEKIARALAGIEQGKTLAEIGQEFGVSLSAVHQFLLGNVPEKYRALQERGLIARITEADEKLENASNHLEVARAREIAKFRRWDAERRLKSLFAPSQEVTGPGGGPIQLDNMERARRSAFLRTLDQAEPIDLEPIASPQSPTSSAST